MPEVKHSITDPSDIIHQLPPNKQAELLKMRKDNFTSVLAAQLEGINHEIRVTYDKDRVYVNVGKARLRDIHSAMCWPGGWPSTYGMVQFSNTLRHLYENGLAEVNISGDGEGLKVEIDKNGRCLKVK